MENTPILNMSLKDYYNIIVNGGKITRNKTDHSKTTTNEKNTKTNETKETKPSLKLKKKSSKIKVKGENKDKKSKKMKKEKKISKKNNSISSNYNTNKIQDTKNISKEEKIIMQKIKKIKSIRKDNNVFFPIDYEIVPFNNYFDKKSNYIYFELSEKIVYNKTLQFENYKERVILFRLKRADQQKYSIGSITDVKVDEEKQLIIHIGAFFEIENSQDNCPFAMINQEKIVIDSKNYDIFLIEFTFCLKNNGDIDYLVILTEFINKFDENKSVVENRYYNQCFSLRQNRIISKIENRKLLILEEIFEENMNFNIKDIRFFQKINKVFLEWLERVEYQRICKSLIENYELHECIYPKKDIYQLGLLLKYDKVFESAFVVSYRGEFEWIALKKIKENNEDNEIFNILNTKLLQDVDLSEYKSEKTMKINILKGKVSYKQLSNFEFRENFYKNLFFQKNKTNNEKDNSQNDTICPEVKIEVDKFEDSKNLECQNCTYKINNFEFRKCDNCKIALHVQCMTPFEKNYESGNLWLCRICKPCKNCHSATKLNSKTFCSVCFNCYHSECLYEMVPKYAQSQDSNKYNWKCEYCAKCLGCDKMLYRNFKYPTLNGNNLEYCSTCEKRIDKNEFCPICKKLWKIDEMKMIECKCKMWVHQVCDRILTDEYFKKLSKKAHNYFCPLCRVKDKNIQIVNILNLLIKQDKYGYFSLPVEKVKNYSNVIKKPMCFIWMRDKVEKGIYLDNPDEFGNDFNVIFTNAKIFNMPNTKIYKEAEIIHERGMEILESNLGTLYSISLDYYLFDHNFHKNDIKEIISFVKTKFENKMEIINLNKIKEKIKDYKLEIYFADLLLEGKNTVSSNIQQNQISCTDSSISGKKKKSSNILNNINCDDENKSLQNNIPTLSQLQINNIYFQKRSDEITNKNEEIKDNSILKVNPSKVQSNIDIIVNDVNSEKLESEIKETKETILSPNKSNIPADSLNKFDKGLLKSENKDKPNVNYTMSDFSKNEANLINETLIQEKLKEEPKIVPDIELKKEIVENPIEINKEDHKIVVDQNKNGKINKMKHKIKMAVKNKTKLMKDFENYIEKSMNNFNFKQKTDLKLVDNKMEIMDANDNLQEDEEENFISNYIQKHSNGIDNCIKFFYLKKYKEILEINYDSYLDLAYGCTMFRQNIKEMKKNKHGKKVEVKSNIAKDSKKRLKLISKNKDKDKKELSLSFKPEIQQKSSRKESLDSLCLKKKKERTKSKNDLKDDSEKETNVLNLEKINNSKFKSEEVLYQENYNFKSLLPPPIMVCFSDIKLIFQKNCYLCASFDQVEYMITCSLCYESFHSFCSSNSDQLTNNLDIIKKTKWKCLNCKFCEKCKTNTNDHELLYCDSCDASLHSYCLDVKLYQIPESGWKCLNCFKCQNCKSTKYYSDKFKIDESKDYSILTRNFTYCFECGFKLFYQSLCNRCEKSEYKDYNKNIIFVENKNDINEKYENNSILDTNDNNVVMIACNNCKYWYHLKCLGFTKEYLIQYFKEYDNFRCLDCFTDMKYKGELQEITYVRYLELLQMSYIIMSFSKLILIILKLMTKDSNIKLHSKLFKVFLQENIRKLLNDQDICFFIEAIKQDIFLHKNGKNGEKKKKKSPLLLKKNEENDKIMIDTPIVSQENVNIGENSLSDVNMEEQPQSFKFFDLKNHLRNENLFKEKYMIEKYKYFTHSNLNLNEELNNNIHLIDKIELNKNKYLNLFEVKYNSQYLKNIAKDIVITNADIKNEIDNKENLNFEKLLRSKEKLELLGENRKNNSTRINYIYDSKMKEELNNFLEKKEKKIKIFNNYFDNPESKILAFYSFDYPKYFTTIEQKETKIFINEVLKKFESYIKAKNLGKIFSKFWLQLNYKIIIKLKVEFLKWLIEKIRDSYTQSPKDFSKINNTNLIYPFFIDFSDKLINENPFITGELSPQDPKQEEDLCKLMDYIDPLENIPVTSLTCEFCNRKGGRKYSGRIIPIKGEMWGHINCILWSRGVVENTENGSLMNVLLIMNKMKTLKCYLCKKVNATLSCDSKKCNKNYHFVCSLIKQSAFTRNKQFFCNKCIGTKDEYIYDFNTFRKFTVLRNNDWIHDAKFTEKTKIQLIPKYVFGALNKFGNTTIIKLANLHQKENVFESFDIVCIKKIIRDGIDEYLLFLLNDRFIAVNKLSDTKLLMESNILKEKIMKIYKKIDKDVFDHYLSNCLQKEGILFVNPSDKVVDFSNDSTLKSFNELFENFLRKKVCSYEELDLCKKINRKVNNCLYFFNLNFIPINIFMRNSTFYISQYSDFSTNCEQNLNITKSNENETRNNKKEAKNKLESFINSIKEKNKNSDTFRFIDYLSNHKSIKIVRKNLVDSVNTQEKDKKTTNKYNKQIYKNLERTMNTNIMETDLPLAMKYRNYKALARKVTVGPSFIHRNGLMATGDFLPGEIVIEYCGELISNHVADFREKEYNIRGFGDCYLFRLDTNQIIDATKYGNLARFINHRCDPNCSAQSNVILDKKHIILYAKRHIKAGEEITYDYNFECEAEKILCRCGAKNCQGRLN